MRILLVEDDESIVEVVTAILDAQNYIVDVAADGEAGWELAEAFPYDLVLLDIILPKLDGITFCRRLRERKHQALVMLLTARDTMTDKLIGLEAGADDYVVKPFHVQEVAARIRALLRRGHSIAEAILTCGHLHLDPGACEVTYKNQLLRFSRKEYLLLELFLRHQNRVFSRSAIVDQIWSFNEDPPNEDTVKSHIKSIRRKLDAVGAADLIETLYGQGYRINPVYLSQTREQVREESQTQGKIEQKQETLSISVLEIWQRTKGLSLARINSLEQAVQTLKAGALDPTVQQRAIQDAHKLVGSLGTFGFETGSRIAQNIEALLQSQATCSTAAAQKRTAAQIAPLITALKMEFAEQSGRAERTEDPEDNRWPEQVGSVGEIRGAELLPQNASLLLALLSHNQELIDAIVAQATEQNLRTVVVTTAAMAKRQLQQRPQVILIDAAYWQTKQDSMQLTDLLTELHKPPIVAWLFNRAVAMEQIEAIRAGVNLFLDISMPVDEMLKALVDAARPVSLQPKVLLVDDDPIMTKLLTACLKPQGIQVTGLEDPTQFWTVLQHVNPDLLILDVNMPQINGIELCQTVRCNLQWRLLPVMFLTTQSDPRTEQQIFLSGADDLIFKPAKPLELSIRVLNRLRRQFPSLIYPPPSAE